MMGPGLFASVSCGKRWVGMNNKATHRRVVKITVVIMDTILLMFLIWFGITHNLFNWGADWWYSLLTLLQVLRSGNTMNWNDRED